MDNYIKGFVKANKNVIKQAEFLINEHALL